MNFFFMVENPGARARVNGRYFSLPFYWIEPGSESPGARRLFFLPFFRLIFRKIMEKYIKQRKKKKNKIKRKWWRIGLRKLLLEIPDESVGVG